jgi:Tfp pilus assembly protein PilF
MVGRSILPLLLATLVAACATPAPAPQAPPPSLFEDAAFGVPGERPDARAVFALSPRMRDYLERDLSGAIRSDGRQRALVDALHRRAGLRLEYDAEMTRTAAQAFDARSGNCLSLVVMTAALAKQLELPVSFQVLDGYESFSRSGGLSFANGHVNITVAKRLIDRVASYDGELRLRMDFGQIPLGRGQALREVGESTILAMFMNNRAAEHLVRGEIDDAYAFAREAVMQEPAYVGAYNTLGVIYQRRGLAEAAERAYQAALARDETHKASLKNLAALLRERGRGAEALPLEARLAALERDPPFVFFDRGVAAARAGRFAEARDLIRREMRRDPDYHEFHFWLAVALFGLGETGQAREHLDIALRNSTTVRERDIYAAKLHSLDLAGERATHRN